MGPNNLAEGHLSQVGVETPWTLPKYSVNTETSRWPLLSLAHHSLLWTDTAPALNVTSSVLYLQEFSKLTVGVGHCSIFLDSCHLSFYLWARLPKLYHILEIMKTYAQPPTGDKISESRCEKIKRLGYLCHRNLQRDTTTTEFRLFQSKQLAIIFLCCMEANSETNL